MAESTTAVLTHRYQHTAHGGFQELFFTDTLQVEAVVEAEADLAAAEAAAAAALEAEEDALTQKTSAQNSETAAIAAAVVTQDDRDDADAAEEAAEAAYDAAVIGGDAPTIAAALAAWEAAQTVLAEAVIADDAADAAVVAATAASDAADAAYTAAQAATVAADATVDDAEVALAAAEAAAETEASSSIIRTGLATHLECSVSIADGVPQPIAYIDNADGTITVNSTGPRVISLTARGY